MLIDITLVFLALAALIKGIRKGLVVAVFSFMGFIVGLAAALKLSAAAASYLDDYLDISARWLPFLAFVLVFLLVVVLVHIGAKALENLLQISMLGWANRLGGILFYTFIHAFVFSLFLFYAVQLHLIGPETLQASVTYAYIEPLAPRILNVTGDIFPFFKNVFAELEQFFSSMAARGL